MTGDTPSFAMLPRSIIRSGLDEHCFRLYAYCDDIQRDGTKAWAQARGCRAIAADLGWKPDTVRAHGRHLEQCGLLRSERQGTTKLIYNLIHNESRGRINPGARVPPVPTRATRPSSSTPDPLTRRTGQTVTRSTGQSWPAGRVSQPYPSDPPDGPPPSSKRYGDGLEDASSPSDRIAGPPCPGDCGRTTDQCECSDPPWLYPSPA